MLKTKQLTFLILLLLNTTSLATNSDNRFYIKTIAAINKNSDIKTLDSDINFILKHKAPIAPTLGLGVGYYFNESVRMDLTFENTSIKFPIKSGNFDFTEEEVYHFGTRTIERTTSIQSVLLNGYINILDQSIYNVFLGAGLGMGSSQIKEERLDKFDSNIIIDEDTISLPTIYSRSTNKNKKTLAYAFMLGADYNISDGFNVELIYNWKHAGKVKVEDNTNVYQGHNVTVAARFDL